MNLLVKTANKGPLCRLFFHDDWCLQVFAIGFKKICIKSIPELV